MLKWIKSNPLESVMNQFFLCIILFIAGCASDRVDGENLMFYREGALRYIVQMRAQKEISSIKEFKKKGFFSGWHLTIFQKDNVDRSVAFFQVEGEREITTCGLYIREATQADLALNALECKGPYAKELSGANQYGLALLTVPKTHL